MGKFTRDHSFDKKIKHNPDCLRNNRINNVFFSLSNQGLFLKKKFLDENKELIKRLAKSRKKYIYNILNFYESQGIVYLPLALSLSRSQRCLQFFIRVMNKYSTFSISKEENFFYSKNNQKFERGFYTFIQNLVQENILIPVEKSDSNKEI